MKRLIPIALTALALPAAAQVTYSEARIAPRGGDVLTIDELRTCMARDETMAQRRDRLEREKLDVDREAQAITREGQRLADELRSLDSRDVGAVAAYNARSAEHNRRVEAHNRQVADTNARAAALNGDSSRLDALCARPFFPEDRDLILRGTLR